MTNALAEALATAGDIKPGPQCSVARILEGLPADEAASWDATLRDPATGTDKQKADALTRLTGTPIAYNPIRRHRQGMCRCQPMEAE